MPSPTVWRRRLLAGALVLGFGWVTAGPAAAAPAHDTNVVSGSSWAANAINQWVADVKSSGLRINFTSTGSAQGRKDFANAVTDFAVSDIGYQGSDPKTGEQDTSTRPYAYLPIVGGGTSFPYKILVGGKPVTNLRLSGQTIAKIFTGGIINWNDKAITKDNNGRKLPSKPIIPVVHSEGAGSTAQFTQYLAKMFPAIWAPFNGNASFTEYYPTKSPVTAVYGSDGVMNYINSGSGDGTIGYDEYSYPLGLGFPVAKVENAAGYFVLPNQYNDAVALTQAKINMDKSSKDYLLQTLDKVYTYSDPRTYPLSSYSYAVIPTAADDRRMTTAKRQTMADFLFYSVCGGQAAIGATGYSSLPLNLVTASFQQIGKLKQADPKLDLTTQNPANCNNPTFDKAHPNRNHLAEIAPQPAACDRAGAGPCGTASANSPNGATANTNGGTANADPGNANSGTAGTSGGSAGTTGGSSGSDGGTSTGVTKTGSGVKTAHAATVVNPDTGQVETADGSSGGGNADVLADPTELAASTRSTNNTPYAILAAALLALALVTPPLLIRRLNRGAGK
jgi:phosphate transport system substrate-binding protein